MDENQLIEENREALRRVEACIALIGDPQQHPMESYRDLALKLLPVLDPALPTVRAIEADVIVRGVSRYEEQVIAERDALRLEIERLKAELVLVRLDENWPTVD